MLGWIANIGIGSIVGKLAEAYSAHERAQTDQERVAAQERIAALESQRAVMVAEAGNRINAVIRALFAIPVAIYLGKVMFDKILGFGSTDNLSSELWYYTYVVVGFFFVHSIVGRR